ncbi:hypothetical protein [Rodentibacter caecimuris]|uniref:hypothetical protein n=1 Tax=Rodentibacter caecimuris TaxID=1796644 RepID=UPI00211A9088|nr:hypothetical protein [Rodentibacter heylii]MCQ9124437.1 hypothetical protein [Rodentibacter heylii]
MSTTLKVLSAKKVIASHQITQGEMLIIEARDKSNYQLIDDQTGLGPQNIIAKREGKDLKLFLEDGDMSADVVIKGYYGDENSEEVSNLIVGQHENGGIYAYVPESGLKSDAVSMLAEEVAAPQALGGEELASAFWAFNPWWLLALVPLAAGIAIATNNGGSSGGGNENTDNTADKPTLDAKTDGSVTVKPSADNTKVVVKYTDENGNEKTATLTKDSNGNWISDNPDVASKGDGSFTIPADKVKDGSKVTAIGTDDKDNTAGVDATAGNNLTIPRVPGDVDGDGNADGDDNDAITEKGGSKVTIPEATVSVNAEEAKDGIQVDITLPKSTKAGDTVTLTVTKPDGTTATVTRTVTPTDETAGKVVVTIPSTDVGTDGDYKVIAKVTTPDGQESEPSEVVPFTVDQTPPAVPYVEVQTDGSVTITPKDDNPVTITYKDEDGNPQTIVVSKDDQGNWILDNTPQSVTVDSNGRVTIPVTSIKDGEEVKATATDPAGNMAEDKDNTGNNSTTPRVLGDVDGNGDADGDDNDATTEKGGPKVTIPEAVDGVNAEDAKDGVQVDLTLPKNTKEGDTVKLSIIKPNGQVVEIDYTVSKVDETSAKAAVTIPAIDVGIHGNYAVVARVVTPEGQESRVSDSVSFTVDNRADQPTITSADNDGKVTVTPGEDNNKVEIKFKDEDGNDKTLVAEKGQDGSWTVTNDDGTGAIIENGKVIIPSDKVKDGKPVNATGLDFSGNTAEADTVNAGTNPTVNNTADKLLITPENDGSVTVKPGDDNVGVVVDFRDEKNQPQQVSAKKDDNGEWIISYNSGVDGLEVDPYTGIITIPAEALKDNEPVNAIGYDKIFNRSYADPKNAEADPKNAAVDNSNNNGVVSTASADEGDEIVTTVKLTNNNGNEKLPFSLPSGTNIGELSADDFNDKSTFTFSNGVTQNADGTLNVPAGVTEFTITTSVNTDNTTEGEEEGKFTVGGVEGNEITINDTSVADQSPMIDITSIAGQDQVAEGTDGYAQFLPDNVSTDDIPSNDPNKTQKGYTIKGITGNVPEGNQVILTIRNTNDPRDSQTYITTVKADGSWEVKIATVTSVTKTEVIEGEEVSVVTSTYNYPKFDQPYEIIVTTYGNGEVSDIDLMASAPKVADIYLQGNLTDDAQNVADFYTDNDKYAARIETGAAWGRLGGGDGNDTLVLTKSDSKVSLENVLNFEVIDLTAPTAQTIGISNDYITQANDTTKAIYIKGGTNDTVDFGDNGKYINGTKFKDGGGVIKSNWNFWEKTESDVIHDGVTYDKYTYRTSAGEVNDEAIYIQQGIQII